MSEAEDSEAMQPEEALPEAQGSMTGIPLPSLIESVLDEETVNRLFSDIETFCQVLEVRSKQAPRSMAADAPITLNDAREYIQGEGQGSVQLRYVHEGQEWCDTLIRRPTGVQLVRMGDELDPAKAQ